jgi:hypothetical protein
MIGREFAETVALQALGWLAGEEARLGAFLAVSGTGPGELRARAQDPEMMAAVLDFVLSEDGHVLEFTAAAGLRPEAVQEARAALPGGNLPHWT